MFGRLASFERFTDEWRTLPPVSTPTGQPTRVRGNAIGNQYAWILEPCGSGRLDRVLTGKGGVFDRVGVTPDGRRLVAFAGDHTVRTRDLKRVPGKRLTRDRGGDEQLNWEVAFSPDGREFAVRVDPDAIHFWDGGSAPGP